MQSTSLRTLAEIKRRVRDLGQRASRTSAFRDRLALDLVEQEQELVQLSERAERLTKVAELFRVLMDLMVGKQVRTVEGLVTQGLQTIFHDLDLSFEAEVGPKYNKIAVDFFIRQGDKANPLSPRGSPLTSFGGGPCTVASLTLRVLTLLRLKLCPFLVLDETLGAVSEEYIESSARFLSSLSKKLKIDILLVTHKPAFTTHADRAYRCIEAICADDSRNIVLKRLK